jgi:hypothetical protein
MNRARSDKVTEAAILDRMAASRAALLAVNMSLTPASATRGLAGRSVSAAFDTVKEAPRVTLLLALCMSAIVLGPRRATGIALRSGATAWIGSSAQKLMNKAAAAPVERS